MDAKQLGAGWQEGRMSDGNGLHHLTPQEIIIIIMIIIIVVVIIIIIIIVVIVIIIIIIIIVIIIISIIIMSHLQDSGRMKGTRKMVII